MQEKKRPCKLNFRRILAAVLCLVMTVSYMPSMKAMAAEIDQEEAAAGASADVTLPGLDDIEGEGQEPDAAPEEPEDIAPSQEEGEGAPEEGGEIPDNQEEEGLSEIQEEGNLLAVAPGATFQVDLSADETVTSDSIIVNYAFYTGVNGSGARVGNGSLTIFPSQNRRQETTGELEIPETATLVWLDAGIEGGDSTVLDMQNSHINCNNDNWLDETAARNLLDEGYRLTIDDAESLSIDLKFTQQDPYSETPYSISITADENVTANNLSISWVFETATGYELPGGGGLNIHPSTEGEGQYTASTGDDAYLPKTVRQVYIRVQTADAAVVDWPDDDLYYIKVDGTTIFNEDLTKEAASEALASDYGFNINTLSDDKPFDISIHLSRGGNPGPEPVDYGQYYVKVMHGIGLPEDAEPGLNVRFDNQAEPTKYTESMELPEDLPVDAFENRPTAIEISVSEEDFPYLANGNLTVTWEGGESERFDLFNELRDADDHTFTYNPIPGETLPEDAKYEIDVTFANTRSVSWSYLEEDIGTSRYVDHCQIFLLDEEGNDREVIDESDPRDTSHMKGNYQLIVGETYQFRLVPDEGYQVTGLRINDYTVAPADLAHPGIFSFTMEDHNFHMNSVVEEIGTLISVQSDCVGELRINDLEDSSEYEPEADPDNPNQGFDENFGGSYMFTVTDSYYDVDYTNPESYADPDEATEDVMSMVAEDTINITIDQAVARDSMDNNPDYWTEEEVITDLADPVKLAFDYQGVQGADYKVAEEHDGEIYIHDAEYDDGVLSFETSGFSTFTILREKDPCSTVVIDFGDKSEDYLAIYDEEGFVSTFEYSLRIDSQSYNVWPEERDGRLVMIAEVPYESPVSVGISSCDSCNYITEVKRSKDGGAESTLAPDKNGEYSFVAEGDEEWLYVATAPAQRLVIADDDDREFRLEKGRYSLDHDTIFRAYIASGSKVSEEGIVRERAAAQLYNGSTKIADDELYTTGDEMGLSGKSLTLKAVTEGASFTANLDFYAPVTNVTVSGAGAGNVITLPYDTDKSFKVTVDKGANPYEVAAYTYVVNGGTRVYDDEFRLGWGDGTGLAINAYEVLENGYEPGDTILFAFCKENAAGEKVSVTDYSVKLTNPIEAAAAPVIKADAANTTNQAIGVALTLPKNVTATEDMYYRVEAKAVDGSYFGPDDDPFYVAETAMYVPASEKAASVSVLVDPEQRDFELSWQVEYEVTATLLYALPADAEYPDSDFGYIPIQAGGKKSNQINVSTQDAAYETKLALVKKAPSKLFNGQAGVLMAVPKWSATTTVKKIERVEVYDSNGGMAGRWDLWSGSDPYGCYIYVDILGTGAIYMDTFRIEEYEMEGELVTSERELEPGKYTMKVWAIGGPCQPAEASMAFQIADSIMDMYIDCPNSIYKQYNKKASFKATVECWAAFGRKPSSNKVEWSVVRRGVDEEGEYDEPVDWATVKNGTVTIAADYNVSADPAMNEIWLKVKAADYDGNPVFRYSDHPIIVTSAPQIPTSIQLGLRDEESGDFLDFEIAENGEYFTFEINDKDLRVLNQYGDEMDVDVKVSGLTYDKSSGVIGVAKPGKAVITVTSRDGSKNKKELKFTTKYTDDSFAFDVWMNDAGYEPMEIARNASGGGSTVNTYSGSSPIYVHVGGVKDEEDHHMTSQIAHSLSVKGGKTAKTYTGLEEDCTVYTIIPNAHETVITVKDNTAVAGRKGTAHVYTVTNTGISDSKAYSIAADKKSIYNTFWSPLSYFMDEDGDPNYDLVPNRVKFGIKNYIAPAVNQDGLEPDEERLVVARITMDDPYGKGWNLAEAIGKMDDEYNAESGVYYPVENSGFIIDFFDVREEDDGTIVLDMPTIPTGSYVLYATIGVAVRDGDGYYSDFTATGKMTKLTVKASAPPKATGKFKTVKYALDWGRIQQDDEDSDWYARLEVPTVANGLGVKRYMHGDEPVDSFKLVNVNNKGQCNSFSALFFAEDLYEGEYGESLVKDTDAPIVLKPNDDIEVLYIPIDKDCDVRVRNWYEMAMLSRGHFTISQQGDKDYDDDGQVLAGGTEAKQKSAYKKWAKDNLTGFIRYRAVDLGGMDTECFQKITVDIDYFLERQLVQ